METGLLPPSEKIRDILQSLSEVGDPKPGAANLIDVGSSDFINFFDNEILDSFIEKGGSTCRFFEGVYGAGKTHLLQLIEDLALDKGYIICRIELTKDIDFSRPHIITKHILEHCKAKINGQLIRHYPNILEKAGYEKIIQSHSLDAVQLSHSCLQNAIGYAIKRSTLDNEAWGLINRYLLGEKVLVRELKMNGLKGIKTSLTEKSAEQFLQTALNSIHYLGFKGFILLYDETERSWVSNRTPTPKKVQIAANIIRRFIDACSAGDIKGTLAIFAVLPNFIRDCIDCYPALGQRLILQNNSNEIAAWRWPVLPLYAVNSMSDFNLDFSVQKENFFLAAKKKFTELVDYCGGDIKGINDDFDKYAHGELNNWTNEEYRRMLIKTLSEIALLRIEESV